MADNRFKNFPTDARFTSPGSDVRFATPGTDARFGASDTRFEGATYGGAGDVTAPTATSVSLGAQSGGDAPVTVTDLDENSTAYWVLTTSATVPSVAQVKAGQDHTGAAASDSGSFSATIGGGPYSEALTSGLSGTLYLYVVFTDGSGNDSTVYSGGSQTFDTTAPTLSSATGTQTGQTTADWGVTSNEASGTIYAGVRVSTDAAITAAQLIAGSGGTGVAFSSDATPTADANNGGSFTGLTASTTYIVDTVQVDAQGNQSSVVSSSSFTTASSYYPTDLGAKLYMLVDPTDTTTLFTDSDNSKATNVTADGQSVYDIDDASGNGNHSRPVTGASTTSVVWKTGSGRSYLQIGATRKAFKQVSAVSSPAGVTTTMELYAAIRTSTTQDWHLLSDTDTSNYQFAVVDASASTAVRSGMTGASTLASTDGVDESASITRDELHTAWCSGTSVVAGGRNIDMTALNFATPLVFMGWGANTTWQPDNVDVYAVVLTSALTAGERSDLITWMQGLMP